MAVKFTVSLEDKISKPAKAANVSLNELAKGLNTKIAGALNGLVGGLGDSVTGFIDAAKKGDKLGMVMAALAAEVDIATAGFQALYAGMKLAISASEWRTSMVDSMGAMGGKGEEMVAMVRKMGAVLPQSEKQLTQWAMAMQSAGMTDLNRIERSVRAMAGAEAMMGVEGQAAAAKVKGLLESMQAVARIPGGMVTITAEQLIGTGITREEMAAAIGVSPQQMGMVAMTASQGIDKVNAILAKKTGKALAHKMATMDVQMAKVKENFSALFDSVKVGPLTDALGSLARMLDQNSVTGKMLRSIFEFTFNRVAKVASWAFDTIHIAILDLAIVALKFYLRAYPIIHWAAEMGRKFGIAGKAAYALEMSVRGLGIVLAVVLLPILGLVAIATLAIVGPTMAIWFAMSFLVGAVIDAWDDICGVFWKSAGVVASALMWAANPLSIWSTILRTIGLTAAANFLDGLASGIKNGAKWVVDAIGGLGGKVVGKFKSVLGIASPSKVMAALGENMGEGLTLGIEHSTKDVQGAAANMGAAGAAATSTTTVGGARTLTINVGGVNLTGAQGGTAQELTEHAVTLIFERIALQQGLLAEGV